MRPVSRKKNAKVVTVRDDYHLPPVNAAFQIRQTLRFLVNTAQVSKNITAANILDTICFATTATAASQVFEFIRVRRIRLWAMGDGQVPTTVVLFLPGPQKCDGVYITDTSMSVSPAMLSHKPSPKSLVGFWQPTGTDVLMQLSAPAGAVLDLDVDFRTQMGGAAVAVGASVTGATAGVLYRRGCDNLPKATTQFFPQIPDGGVI
jgi:hypothetical protein